MIATIRKLFAYDVWANARVLDSLKTSQHENQRAMKLLAHLLVSEKIWLMRLRGEDTSQINKSPASSIAACESLVDEMRAALAVYLSALDSMDLDSIVTYRNSKGTEFHTPVKDILTHVAFHGTYHRGQIAFVMRSEGMTPVDTDFITFVREHQRNVNR